MDGERVRRICFGVCGSRSSSARLSAFPDSEVERDGRHEFRRIGDFSVNTKFGLSARCPIQATEGLY